MRQRSKHGIALKHPSSNQSSLPQTPSAFNKSVKGYQLLNPDKKNLSPMASSLLASLSNGARVSRKIVYKNQPRLSTYHEVLMENGDYNNK